MAFKTHVLNVKKSLFHKLLTISKTWSTSKYCLQLRGQRFQKRFGIFVLSIVRTEDSKKWSLDRVLLQKCKHFGWLLGGWNPASSYLVRLLQISSWKKTTRIVLKLEFFSLLVWRTKKGFFIPFSDIWKRRIVWKEINRKNQANCYGEVWD